jgi:hypothetical protein
MDLEEQRHDETRKTEGVVLLVEGIRKRISIQIIVCMLCDDDVGVPPKIVTSRVVHGYCDMHN